MLQQGDNSGVTLNLVDRYTTYAWLSTSNEKSYEQGKGLTPWSTSKGIHMGGSIPTATAPGMSTASMNTQGVTPMEKIRGVYYVGYNTKTGNPELTVQGNFDINFQNSSYYSYDLNNATFISGAYVFNINNVNYTISNPMSDYCSLPEITSPEINTAINVKNKINVQWLNLGSDYVYLIFAAHYKLDNTNEADIFWASNDRRDLTTSDMDTFTNLINELTSSNSCTVPANLFTAGTNIKIMVIAVNKEHYNVDTSESVGKTFLGIGQYSVTYQSY